jgi:hypothetical protein
MVTVALPPEITGYSVNSDSDTNDYDHLFRINLNTGAYTKLGIVAAQGETHRDVEGLAFAPDGTLYGVDEFTMTLFPLSVVNGTVFYPEREPLKGINEGPGNDFGMTFACDGNLYITSVLDQSLFRLSLDGTAERIGSPGILGANISALAAWGNPVELYGMGNGLDDNNQVDSRKLYTININTGVASVVGTNLGNDATVKPYKEAGLAFDEGGGLWAITDRREVIGGTFDSQILQIDKVAGTATGSSETTGENGFESLAIAPPQGCFDPDPEKRATFRVYKRFMDDNDVTPATFKLDCNDGHPSIDSKTSIPVNGNFSDYEINFVVTDFTDGQLRCEVFEEPVPKGYTAAYSCDGEAECSADEPSEFEPLFEGPCLFENVSMGDNNSCYIKNYLDPVEVKVTKMWVDEHAELENPTTARVSYACENARRDTAEFLPSLVRGKLIFVEDEQVHKLKIYPNFDPENPTTCSFFESGHDIVDSSVEPDGSDCQDLKLKPGSGAKCTFVNIRLYEGIPTLSRGGLVLFASLMLLIGLLAVRRIS